MIIDSPEEKRVFVVIYEKYRYLMMKVAHDVLKDNFLAEDAVHEAFIKIAHNMQNIHDVESVETKRYLIIVAKNAAIDIYRSRKKMKEKMFIDELGEDAGPITYLKTDIDNEILDILKNLPVKYRDVFLLKYSNHMSNAEISKILNISEGTIRQRIARGNSVDSGDHPCNTVCIYSINDKTIETISFDQYYPLDLAVWDNILIVSHFDLVKREGGSISIYNLETKELNNIELGHDVEQMTINENVIYILSDKIIYQYELKDMNLYLKCKTQIKKSNEENYLSGIFYIKPESMKFTL